VLFLQVVEFAMTCLNRIRVSDLTNRCCARRAIDVRENIIGRKLPAETSGSLSSP